MGNVRVLALAALAVILVGCGSDDAKDSVGKKDAKTTASQPAETSDDPAESGAQPDVDIDITVRNSPKGKVFEGHLKCPHLTRELSPESVACAALGANPDLLDEPPSPTACTEQYGGPQTATIVGTIDDEQVDLKLSRTDGCAIDQWARLQPIINVALGRLESGRGAPARSTGDSDASPDTAVSSDGDAGSDAVKSNSNSSSGSEPTTGKVKPGDTPQEKPTPIADPPGAFK